MSIKQIFDDMHDEIQGCYDTDGIQHTEDGTALIELSQAHSIADEFEKKVAAAVEQAKEETRQQCADEYLGLITSCGSLEVEATRETIRNAITSTEKTSSREKQPPPNDQWCIGCSPDNCSGGCDLDGKTGEGE